MSENTKFRMERIEKLLHELRYEFTRGVMEGDLPDEHMTYQYFVPVSHSIPNGVVMFRLETRPMPAAQMPWNGGDYEPKLRIVK